MMSIPFYKFSGNGNDFIIIDNRDAVVDEGSLTKFIARVCRRRMSAGADGLILVEDGQGVDFRWRYFNADGSLAEMCGNGARCVARFAYLNGIAGSTMSFENEAGIVTAVITDDRVKISMPDPRDLRTAYALDLTGGPLTVSSINTGVPHVVVPEPTPAELARVDVVGLGTEIRHHGAYAPEGTNADFVCISGENEITIRTYERGVEDETLACGTGAIAGAIVAADQSGLTSPVKVRTRSGGFLGVHFRQANGAFHDVHLEGDARVIYSGELQEDAWRY